MPCPQVCILVENFTHLKGVALWACGKLDGHINGLLLMLAQWIGGVSLLSAEHSHTCRAGSGRLCSTDACQDRCIVWVVVAARTASRDEIRPHVEPAVSPRTIGNCLLAGGLRSREPLVRLPLTPWHRQARLLCCERVNWRVLSSVMRVGSVCMWVMDVHVSGVDFVSIIFWSAFIQGTQAPPQTSWRGGGASITTHD